MPTPSSASISVVVPVFNELSGIAMLAERLQALEKVWAGRSVQFVFVDDGSSDGTPAQLHRQFGADPHCLVLLHERNRGIGAAFRTGFAQASGAIVCTIDADCSYGPENLRHLVDEVEVGGSDIAVASPYHPQGSVEGVPVWRLSLSRGCSLLYRLALPVKLYTYTSVFRAYRREVLQHIAFEENGFVSAVEIVIRAAEQGFRISEVPMTLHARRLGASKMKILRTVRSHLSLLFSHRHRPVAGVSSVAH